MKTTTLCTVKIGHEMYSLDKIKTQNGAEEYACYYWDLNIDDQPIDTIGEWEFNDESTHTEAINNFLEYLKYES